VDTPRCNVCGSTDVALYHHQGYRRLMRCRGCRTVFAHPLPSREEKHATEREAYDGDILPEVADFFRNCHRNFKEDPVIGGFRDALRWIGRYREAGQMLDVGPGTGIFVFLAERDYGWSGRGIDICERSAEKARTEFNVDVDIGEFETFGYSVGGFDAITMLDVLEHTLDPSAFVRRAFELLRPGGVLYVSDLLLNDDARNRARYDAARGRGLPYGVFELPEGAILRHHDPAWIESLFRGWTAVSRTEFVAATMNGHTSRAFQLVVRR
jgi:SAM-dependent methyltransferase